MNRRYHARPSLRSSVAVGLIQVAIVVVFLLLWEFLPRIDSLVNSSRFFDPFFISSPSRMFSQAADYGLGRDGSISIWPYLWRTISSSLLGLMLGVLGGAGFGLVLGSSTFLDRVLRLFIVILNATPRIAFIPVIVVLFGPTREATLVTAVMVVFFVTFFNAHEGATSVPIHKVEHARMLGATRRDVMLRVRLPYVLAWVMAAFPAAVSFALVGVVTAEVLTGYNGVGRLISIAAMSANSAQTFAIVVYLGATGASIVAIAGVIKARVLHWWVAEGGGV